MRGYTDFLRGRGRARHPPYLHHSTVEILSDRVEQCVVFYQDVLGLRLIQSPIPQAIWFKEGVHLYWGSGKHLIPEVPPAAHLALVMGGDYTRARLAAREDGAFIQDASVYWGSLRCYVKDPSDNRIELMEYAP